MCRHEHLCAGSLHDPRRCAGATADTAGGDWRVKQWRFAAVAPPERPPFAATENRARVIVRVASHAACGSPPSTFASLRLMGQARIPRPTGSGAPNTPLRGEKRARVTTSGRRWSALLPPLTMTSLTLGVPPDRTRRGGEPRADERYRHAFARVRMRHRAQSQPS